MISMHVMIPPLVPMCTLIRLLRRRVYTLHVLQDMCPHLLCNCCVFRQLLCLLHLLLTCVICLLSVFGFRSFFLSYANEDMVILNTI